MKLEILFFILPILSFLSCKNSIEISKIKVGMTYDEVENIVGKPISITRGANEFSFINPKRDYNYPPYLTHTSYDSVNLDSTRWIYKPDIITIGNLIYVTWVYKMMKIDTNYILVDKYKKKFDTNYTPITSYYLGNEKVNKDEYEKSDGYIYKNYRGEKTDKQLYYFNLNKIGLVNLPKPEKIEKKIIHSSLKNISSHNEIEKTVKYFYKTTFQFCVLFDAASGRVTNVGYFPFEMVKLDN